MVNVTPDEVLVRQDFTSLRDALDGLFAYDSGATDSGIRDESLRQLVKDYLWLLEKDKRRRMLSLWVASYLTEEAIAQGHGWEDAGEAARWLADDMGFLE